MVMAVSRRRQQALSLFHSAAPRPLPLPLHPTRMPLSNLMGLTTTTAAMEPYGKICCALVMLSLVQFISAAQIGVGFGMVGRNVLPNSQALTILRDRQCYLLKTWSIDPNWLDEVERVYAGTSQQVEVTVAIPNSELQKSTWDVGYLNWVASQLQAHKKIIRYLAIGNEPFATWNRAVAMPHLVASFHRVQKMLIDSGLDKTIKLIIPYSAEVLTNTYPVANTVFHDGIMQVMRETLPHIASSGSAFSINLYTYFAFANGGVPLDVALGRSGSLLKNMIDGVRVALDKVGFPQIPILVGETGWPSAEAKGASVDNARDYTRHVNSYASKSDIQSVFFFEAFDEPGKPDPPLERHFGLFTNTGTPKFDFSIASSPGGPASPVQWNGHNWASSCDFKGNDLSNVQTPADKCGSTCAQTTGCTHYTWTHWPLGLEHGRGTCWMKSGTVSKSDAYRTQDESSICGVVPPPVDWHGNDWAFACDFDDHDLSSAPSTGAQCGLTCFQTSGCTHFTWTQMNGGTCWMKSGDVSKADAFATDDQSSVCGVVNRGEVEGEVGELIKLAIE